MRYRSSSTSSSLFFGFPLFVALIEKFKEGYGIDDFRRDLMAGVVVGMVAVPLGMALGIASGVAPQYGLYTVIIAGGLVALMGGSRFQVTGPTAAFVVILAPVVQEFGFGGLLIAGLMAGLMLIGMGMFRLGRLIQFIPYPVTTGFTTGIATVIATLQLKDLFGLKVPEMPERFLRKISALFAARETISLSELSVGLVTLAFLILWPRVNTRIPAPLVALLIVSIGAVLLRSLMPEFEIATIGNQFSYEIEGVKGHGVPRAPPVFEWPWNHGGADGRGFSLNLDMIKALLPSAFAIAMLGAIESLLSAVVADGMARTKHDPDAELVALGVANVLCPFFGGIPATGAIARTATNIRFGARSPLSAVIHAIFALLAVLVFAPYISYLPMAALAALLIFVAYNMSEARHFAHILRVAPRSDVVVLLICFSLTVLFDMVIGVTVGVVLAALLFMKRMAEVTSSQKVDGASHPLFAKKPIPHDVVLYRIEGPLFFGAAEKAAATLMDIGDHVNGVIFLTNDVPTMDMTGLVALESAINELCDGKRTICLVGLRRQPRELISKSSIVGRCDVFIAEDVETALELMKRWSEAPTGIPTSWPSGNGISSDHRPEPKPEREL